MAVSAHRPRLFCLTSWSTQELSGEDLISYFVRFLA
jgi:hypothetical protein